MDRSGQSPTLHRMDCGGTAAVPSVRAAQRRVPLMKGNVMADVEHTVSVPGVPEPIQKLPTDVMQVSGQMLLLTWLAFGIAAFCLHKLLWKPILRAVEGRERAIGDALDGAAQARRELAESESRKRQTVEQAAEEARAMAEQATREAAATLARADLESKALGRRRLEEAEQALDVERRKAVEAVRLDAATHLGEVLERFLRQELTEEQKRAYQSAIVGEVKL